VPTTNTTAKDNKKAVQEKLIIATEEKPNACDETNVEVSEQPNAPAETTESPTKLDNKVAAAEEHKSPQKEDTAPVDVEQKQLSGEEVARKRPFSEITKGAEDAEATPVTDEKKLKLGDQSEK